MELDNSITVVFAAIEQQNKLVRVSPDTLIREAQARATDAIQKLGNSRTELRKKKLIETNKKDLSELKAKEAEITLQIVNVHQQLERDLQKLRRQ